MPRLGGEIDDVEMDATRFGYERMHVILICQAKLGTWLQLLSFGSVMEHSVAKKNFNITPTITVCNGTKRT